MKKIQFSDKPNAFAFKLKTDDGEKICVCPRIDDKWAEDDIFYLEQDIPTLNSDLDADKFNIIFINLVPVGEESFNISVENGSFLKSNHSPAELYKENKFFDVVEKGYIKLYDKEFKLDN
jgi:hypothetical protein|tara:strand:+ start:2006 stop:2365 length:360 start_codon:yes stop_codon:yes gene_type:complete